MESKVANLPDRSVRYLEAGAGRPVVFLHAFPLSADQWLPQLHRLPPGWRGVAPDLRGFRGGLAGFEAAGLERATVDTYAEDVIALMTHLEIERAVVVGLSMGGYVALALWRRASARIAGLVLANTRATPDSPEALAGRDRMIALVEREGARGVASEMLPKLLGKTSQHQQPDLVDVVRQMIEVNSAQAIASATRAMKLRPDSTSLLAAIGCPALVISGAEDTLIPEQDPAAMRAAIPGARALVIAHAGHLSNLEAPMAFNEALSAFLTGDVPAQL